jgi:hypothetical protein
MALSQPLAEWSYVTRGVHDGETSREFTVLNDGSVIEFSGGDVHYDTISRLELRILDALADQINREPIPPADSTSFPSDGDGGDRFLFLGNEAEPIGINNVLFLDTAEGTTYASDDALDVVEIAALNAYMAYLDRKYGPDLDV